MSQSIYFGGSRHLSQMPAVICAAVSYYGSKGNFLHVGCQVGADLHVIQSATAQKVGGSFAPQLRVFSVASSLAVAPRHISLAYQLGAQVTFGAGSQASNIKARYLLRSIAAFQSCNIAIFFYPGAGSLAVAREAVKAGIPVYVFGEKPPRIPSTVGAWAPAIPPFFTHAFMWQWQTEKDFQEKLF